MDELTTLRNAEVLDVVVFSASTSHEGSWETLTPTTSQPASSSARI